MGDEVGEGLILKLPHIERCLRVCDSNIYHQVCPWKGPAIVREE